jgi:predicted DNA-binding transcriptional regulator YafY
VAGRIGAREVSSRPLPRAARLHVMARLLRARSRTAEELADLMGVSLRTIQRDLMTLQTAPFYMPLVREVRWSVMERASEP